MTRDLKPEPEPPRKAYEKPRLEVIELNIDEAVLTACKRGGLGGPGGNSCPPGLSCPNNKAS
jgi:hypothetical protein